MARVSLTLRKFDFFSLGGFFPIADPVIILDRLLRILAFKILNSPAHVYDWNDFKMDKRKKIVENCTWFGMGK